MSYRDYARGETIDMAMDILDNTDASLEEAMAIALESQEQKAGVIDMAMDILDNTDASLEEAMAIALEKKDHGHYNYPSYPSYRSAPPEEKMQFRAVPTSKREYSDYNLPEKVVMQGLNKWIDDYNRMPDCPTRDKLARKIGSAINNPLVRDSLMNSGRWDQIPEGIKRSALARKYKGAMKKDAALRKAYGAKESFYDDIDDDSYNDYDDTPGYDYDDDDYYM